MISLASSADTFSLITEGALSTNPLASTNPNPVISLTALITATLVPPTSVNVTLTSVGSAAAPASAAAMPADVENPVESYSPRSPEEFEALRQKALDRLARGMSFKSF